MKSGKAISPGQGQDSITPGRDHYLCINPKTLDEASAWIEAQRARWTARLDALDAVLKAEDAADAKGQPK